MQKIKLMLTGILIILLVIVFHLHYIHRLWPDYIAIIGIVVFLRGYFKGKDSKDEE